MGFAWNLLLGGLLLAGGQYFLSLYFFKNDDTAEESRRSRLNRELAQEVHNLHVKDRKTKGKYLPTVDVVFDEMEIPEEERSKAGGYSARNEDILRRQRREKAMMQKKIEHERALQAVIPNAGHLRIDELTESHFPAPDRIDDTYVDIPRDAWNWIRGHDVASS